MQGFGKNPLIFVALLFLLLIVSTQLLGKRGSSTTLNDKERVTRTSQSLGNVVAAEEAYKKANGRYTGELSDLIAFKPTIADDLSDGILVQVDAGQEGKNFIAQINSSVLTLIQASNGVKTTKSCFAVKSVANKVCPRKQTKPPKATVDSSTTVPYVTVPATTTSK